MARRNHNSRRSDTAPGWVWMLFGLGVGLIVAIGVYLRTPSGTRAADARTAAVAETAAPRAAPASERRTAGARPAATAAGSKENRFDFYEILPQFEVAIPEDDAPAAATTASRPRPAAAPGTFLLQAGSFSAAADADRLKANLALLGFESHVQRVTIEDDIFNRVRIGPIADLDTAQRIQRQLRAAGIDPLLMKVPN